MRPEKFRYEMDRAFDEYFETKSISRFLQLTSEMDRVWKKWSKLDVDSRSGEETYGYESEESVMNNMSYISDRWRCAFRLKWVLDGVRSGKIK